MADVCAQLKEHLEKANDWDKLEAPIPGVWVVKIPATKTRPALLNLEINPLNDDGKPIKKRGLFVGNYELAMKFHEALSDKKVFDLLTELEKINPEVEGTLMKKLEM